MKFSKAAVALLLAVPAAAAFVPVPHAFVDGTKQYHKQPAFTTRDWALASTTVKKTDTGVNGLSGQSSVVPDEFTAKLARSAEEIQASAEDVRQSSAAYLAQYEGQTGAGALYSKLQEYGTTVVNGYSGGAVLPILDQFHVEHPRHQGQPAGYEPIRWITNSNESSAGHVAEGYAKGHPILPSGELPVGVAIATSGPGVTNLITPLQDAICDGVPIVVICGQAATTAPKDAFQFAPAVALTEPCTKWSYQVKSAAEIPFALDYAFFIARNGRPGPVFLDFPKDLQIQVITKEVIDSFVDTNLTRDANNGNLAHLVTRQNPSGEMFDALHLGRAEQGLAFEVAKTEEQGPLQLKPVKAAAEEDVYHKDHHVSHSIVYTDAETKASKVGELKHGDAMLKDIVRMIQQAKKPIILAGQGCNDCPEDLKAFAEALQIPVTTTLHALGAFDERHNLALNMMGMHGHPTPNFMVQESDLIICIGSRFDDRITGRPSDFIPQAKLAAVEGRGGVIHVDIRLSENAAQIEPTYFVHSTGKSFLQAINAMLEERPSEPVTGEWLQNMRELQQEYPVQIPKYEPETIKAMSDEGTETMITRTRMSAQLVVSEMDRQLLEAGEMDNTIFTTGVGIHQMVTAQLVTWTQTRQMLSSGSLGTMGVALGYAVGAKLANWAKRIIGVDGDGSFNMTFTELKTVAEQKIPVKMMILDNESQMMVEYWQRLFHDARYLAVHNSNNPDYQTLAAAFGIRSIYVDAAEDLEEKMREFLFDYPDEPVIFHVRIERTPCLPLVAPGQPLHDMILEDKDFEVDKSAAPS